MSSDVLIERLDAVRRSWRAVETVTGVLTLVAGVLALLLATFLADWLIVAPIITAMSWNQIARALLDVALLMALAQAFRRWVWTAMVRVRSDDRIAVAIERQHPELRSRLISTIQLTRGHDADHAENVQSPQGSRELIAALAEDTLVAVEPLDFATVIARKPLKNAALYAAGAVLVAVALLAWRPDYGLAFARRLMLARIDYPTATRILSVTANGNIPHSSIEVPHGDALTIEIECDPTGVLPEVAELNARVTATGKTVAYRMDRITDPHDAQTGTDTRKGGVLYRAVIDHVLDDLEIRPTANDARWPDWIPVRALARPAVKNLSLTLAYPDYLKQPTETTTVGDLSVPVGTTVTVHAGLTRAVATAVIARRAGDKDLPATAMTLDAAQTAATGSFVVSADGSYRLQLKTADGLDDPSPVAYTITALPDQAPAVRITFPATDKVVTRFAGWPIRFSAHDDHGLSGAWLRWRVQTTGSDTALAAGASSDATDDVGAQELALAGLSLDGTAKDLEAAVTFDLRIVPDLEAGQRVEYWIECADNRPAAGDARGARGQSTRYSFQIVDAAALEEQITHDRQQVLSNLRDLQDKQDQAQKNVENLQRDLELTKPTPVPTPKKP